MCVLLGVPLLGLGLLLLSRGSDSNSLGAAVNIIPLENTAGDKVIAQYSVLAPLPCPSLQQPPNSDPGYTAHLTTSPLEGLYPSPGWCLCQWMNIIPSTYTSTINLGSVLNEVLPVWSGLAGGPDTWAVNHPPITALLPPLRVSTGCSRRIALNVKDLDNDDVRCRYAGGTSGKMPFLQLSEEDCLLTYSGGGDLGQYELSLTIEDFSSSSSSVPMSSVPLYLSFTVMDGLADCIDTPVFVGQTPTDGTKFTLLPYEMVNITVTAQSQSEIISEIAVVGPPDLQVSAHQGGKTTGSVASVNIVWLRTPNQLAQLLSICFTANTESSQSETRCVWINQKPMDALPSGTVLQCSNTEMNLILPMASFTHLSPTELQLNSPSCPISYNNTHVMAVISLTGCGTQLMQSGSELIYTNSLRTVRAPSIISRRPILVLPLACHFPVGGVGLNSLKVNMPTELEAFGYIGFWIHVYKNGIEPLAKNTRLLGNKRLAQMEVRSAQTMDVLDFHLSSNCSVNRAEMVVGNCVVSYTPGFEVTYPFVDGCSSSKGITEMISTDPLVKIYRVDLGSLDIQANEMFVQCVVHLCIATIPTHTCPTYCSTKQKVVTDALVTHNYTVRSGGIVLIPAPSSTTRGVAASTILSNSTYTQSHATTVSSHMTTVMELAFILNLILNLCQI